MARFAADTIVKVVYEYTPLGDKTWLQAKDLANRLSGKIDVSVRRDQILVHITKGDTSLLKFPKKRKG
tara:strand:- start:8662 stop:8865 length:204 start_codon:yes stop_codon:yes gene_type:complete